MVLSGRQFTATAEIRSVQRGARVHDEEAESSDIVNLERCIHGFSSPGLRHKCACTYQQAILVICIVGSRIRYVIKHFFAI